MYWAEDRISVAKPWGESDRYDLLVETGGRFWRVQVKSAHSSAINGYSFHACGRVHSRRYTPNDIDFIIGYVVPAEHNLSNAQKFTLVSSEPQ